MGGVILSCLIGGSAFAKYMKQSIEVVFNKINIQINGNLFK